MRGQRKKIKWWHIVLVVIVTLVSVYMGGSYIVSESNYSYNAALEETASWKDKYIIKNYETSLLEYKYGLNGNQTNLTPVIASYNILKYMSLNNMYEGEYSLSSVIKYFDLYGSVMGGYLGTNPLAVKWYLQKTLGNVTVDWSLDQNTYEDRMSQTEIFILVTYEETGPVYSAIYRTPDGDDNIRNDDCKYIYSNSRNNVATLMFNIKEYKTILYTITVNS